MSDCKRAKSGPSEATWKFPIAETKRARNNSQQLANKLNGMKDPDSADPSSGVDSREGSRPLNPF